MSYETRHDPLNINRSRGFPGGVVFGDDVLKVLSHFMCTCVLLGKTAGDVFGGNQHLGDYYSQTSAGRDRVKGISRDRVYATSILIVC